MADVSLTEAQSGSSVRVRMGDEVIVALAENPTTGFRWVIETDVEPVLKATDSDFTPASVSAPGATGKAVFHFLAAVPGETRLSLVSRREWQPDEVVERFEVRVVIES